jgi:predicted kinase
MIEARLRAGAQVTYIDSTALSHSERRAWVRFAELHDCDIEAVFFNTPLEVCRRRNQARRRIVPAEAMDRLARKLTPPRLEEGFRKVTLISAPNP